MKRFLFLAGLLAITSLVSAATVSLQKARKVALNAYAERAENAGKKDLAQVVIYQSEAIGEEDNPLIYVFNMANNQGFVLVSADDASIPLLAYALTGNFNSRQMPAAIESWISAYTDQIREIRQRQLPADQEAVSQWNHYLSADFQPIKGISGVLPLLTTNWDQGCYYNTLCPVAAGGDCNRAWAGCVATAMGMVMKYHNYPAQGSGSHSYTHPSYGTLSANFGTTTYQWGSMPNVLYSNNNAVATLLYHCGISVDMNYGANGSGAYTQDVRNALINYFNYAPSAQYVQKLWYSVNDWEALLRNNLDGHRPIVYSGQDPSYGHAFVCDGYQGTNYFHFNWGWSGWNNGYFYVNNLNSGNGTFNNNQAAVVNIAPATAPTADFMAVTTQFCNTAMVQFWDVSNGSPTSWSWQFPGGNPQASNLQNPTVSFPNPGQYNITLTVQNATSSHTNTKYNYIKVIAPPQGWFPSDTTVCCNHVITLDAGNPGATYAWSTGAVGQSTQVDSTGVGIGEKWVYVDIVSPEGCWNKDSVKVVFASCFGIDQHSPARMTLRPNPSNGQLHVLAPAFQAEPFSLHIYSAQGQIVVEEHYPAGTAELQLELFRLPKGLYLVKLFNNRVQVNDKLLLH